MDGIDEENTAQLIILNHPELSWMSINPMGTTLYVDVKERVAPPTKNGRAAKHNGPLRRGNNRNSGKLGRGACKARRGGDQGTGAYQRIVTYKDGTTVFRAAEGVVKAQVSSTVRVRKISKKPLRSKRVGKRQNVLFTFSVRTFRFIFPTALRISKSRPSMFR